VQELSHAGLPDVELPIYVAIILGIVEGLTEFLPVSSTGHLIITAEYLGFHDSRTKTFEIFIQLGAILAVAYLYRQRLFDLFPKFNKNSDKSIGFRGWNGIKLLSLACFPMMFLGALFHKEIKEHLFTTYNVAIGFIIGGILLLVLEKFIKQPQTKDLDQLTQRQTLIIGAFQCLSLWPGMSRSGSTIIGALTAGVDRQTAAQFSFFVAIPIMFIAVSYELYQNLSNLNSHDLLPFALGFSVAFLCALLSVKAFISFISKFSLAPFAWYRILFGSLLILSN
jgi:undecaprenyl-diphosphatase